MTGSLMIYDLRKPSAPKAQLEGHETQIKHVEFAYSREFRKDREQRDNSREIKVKENVKENPVKESKLKTLTSNPSNENIKEDEEKQSRVVRNLSKREEYQPPQNKVV